MIKDKFGDHLRSKTRTAQINEAMCKVLAHNLCCLIQSITNSASNQPSGKRRPRQVMRHYHKRSNVESTFAMMKAKFGDKVRSKTPTAQKNEVLCKALCHNIARLIQSMYELNVKPGFWSEAGNSGPVTGIS